MGDDIIAFIPLMIVLAIVAIPVAGQYFAFRRRKAALDLARDVLLNRDDVDADLISILTQDGASPARDFRRAVLFAGLAIAGLGFSLALENPDARRILQFSTLFPGILSAILFVFSWLGRPPKDAP